MQHQSASRGSFVNVPGERLSVRISPRAWGAAVAVVVLAGVVFGYLVITHHTSLLRRPNVCVADAPGNPGYQLGVSQAEIAATIAGVADRRAMPTRALVIAYAAAMQESKLADLNYGDQDSVGVFQQRPSEGWGSARQIENPVYASNRFFAALAGVHDYLQMPIYQAAQAVQRSADGQAYAQWAPAGSQLAVAYSGQLPHAVWCSYSDIGRKAKLASPAEALRSTFGLTTVRLAGDPAVQVSGTRQGWAVAAWLVSHAGSYRIRDVRYRGYQWLSYTGTGRWVKSAVAARAPAATAVVFG